ncbi:MAG: glycosyltransferase family 2 protein [bacterium]|nr:glycosyltransferase family 2 protein [bacterium]
MGPEIVAYPFLFLAIFFESFILVTFLSKPARRARGRVASSETPSVAIIVPCLNESATVAATCESLLALEYPAEKLSVILVDNGSTDTTPEVMARFKDHPQVTLLLEKNRGKHLAVNAGIATTTADIVGCLDADSFVEPGALREMVGCFENLQVGATTAAMSVHRPRNILQHMQNAEYIYGIVLRHSMSTVNGIHVTPGPFSLYRRETVVRLGGFRAAYQTEDLEMCLRLQKAGYLIEHAPHARVYTKAPHTLFALLKQRTRWTSGFLRNMFNYRGMIGNRRYGALGMIVLPIAFPAMLGGITMFFASLLLFGTSVVHAYQIRDGIPFSYAYLPHAPAFDWFYIPSSVYLLLVAVTIIGMLTLIALGKRISKTPGSLLQGMISYLLLYSLIAPLWLMRSTVDVAIGKKRAWR